MNELMKAQQTKKLSQPLTLGYVNEKVQRTNILSVSSRSVHTAMISSDRTVISKFQNVIPVICTLTHLGVVRAG